jgi:hypothetical protein
VAVIHVFNALARGFEHVPFDSALLSAVAEAFPGEPVRFSGERQHLQDMQAYLESNQADRVRALVEWRELNLPPRMATTRERLADDLRIYRTVLSEAKGTNNSRIIASYIHPVSGLLALKALRFAYGKSVVACVQHGSMVRLLASRRYHPLLTQANGKLRQIVLGDSVRAEVVQLLPRLRGKLYAIRHPYFFQDQDAAPSELPAPGPVGFSFLGVVDEMKGFGDFRDLAETFSPSAGRDGAHFDLIGGTRDGALPDVGPCVTAYRRDGPMPRSDYEAHLHRTHYAVFPYKPSYYKLTASGSVLDALAAAKPIIAQRNTQFEEMFRTMGDIGYLCDDVRDMKSVVAQILARRPHDRYRQQSQNILARRHVFGPKAVASQLMQILSPGPDGRGGR